MTAGTEVVVAEATGCYVSCTFDWSVDGVDAGTTLDDEADTQADTAGEFRARPLAVGFFTARSQLSHVFATGTHVVTVTITDALQRTVTLEVEFDVAAAPLGSPPETDTLADTGSSTAMPRLPIAVYLVGVGLVLIAAGFQVSRRRRSGI
jgi:hypothetical protein